jgi:hypothetical protein
MARTTGTASLADLVRTGVIESGETIVMNRRSAPPIEATVQPDGTIRAGAQSFTTPSGAAKRLLAVGAVDGWRRWRVPRLDYRSLDELRVP